MKVQFDAPTLSSQLRLMRALSPSKGVVGEDLIGLGVKDGKLVVYAYAGKTWVRAVLECTVEENGVVLLDRARFFKLLDALKDIVTLKFTSGQKQAEITTHKTSGKFMLKVSQAEIARPRLDPTIEPRKFEIGMLRDQLQLNILDGDLVGGGYKVKANGLSLTVMATDRQRLVVTYQTTQVSGLDLSIHPQAIKGVFEVLKAASETVEIRTSLNLTSFTVEAEGASLELGYANTSEVFPQTDQLLEITDYPNHARFEVGDLLGAIVKADALAEEELPYADLDFTDNEVCILKAASLDGSAELKLDCPSEISETISVVIRLQLPHLKSLLNKARGCGAAWVTCQWGEKLPVKWSFDFEEAEEHKYAAISLVYITAALNKGATAHA